MNDVARFRCSACGAPVGEHDLQCGYCKAQLATVSCPRCFGSVSVHARFCPFCGATLLQAQPGEAPSLPCPGCGGTAKSQLLGAFPMHACEGCGGVWVANDVLDRMIATHEERGVLLSALKPEETGPSQPITYRPCPVCTQRMNRVNYGRMSGVIVDVCKQHGTWFDADELRRALAFVDGGGLVKARQRELQDLEQRKSLAPLESGPVAQGAWFGGEESSRGSDLLFQAIFKLLT